MQTSSIYILHYDEDLLVGFERFIEFGNIWMVELLHDFHFSFDRFTSIRFEKLDFLVDFDSYFLIQNFMKT